MKYYKASDIDWHYVGSIFTDDKMTHSVLNSFPAQLPAGTRNISIPGHNSESIFDSKQSISLLINTLKAYGVTHVSDLEYFDDESLYDIAEYEEILMTEFDA